jgi:hypothetical protein
MRDSFPLPRLSVGEYERAVLDHLLSHEFQGVHALRAQARVTQVRGLWEDQPTIVLLEVHEEAPVAEVAFTVPIEARVRDVEPPQEVLLFVKQGRLDSIELVDYGGGEPDELPSSDRLEPPTGRHS